ncbi:MAG: SWI/SNF complex component snf12 [Cirrosporium novae-zelandiae]|nr:MAG: SWI/SNF complex component snf12 [Cirrosporium novae-zelandiae]
MQMRPQYGTYQQQTNQWPPHQPAVARRSGPVAMVPPPSQSHSSATAAHLLQQQQRNSSIMAQHDEARRRARRPVDKTIPDGVEGVVIGDGVKQYRQLRDMERELDMAMIRKRMDLDEDRRREDRRVRTMRIWISNTADNQPWQDGNVEIGDELQRHGSARVRIEGRLLPEEDDDVEDSENESEGEKQEDGDEMDHDHTPSAAAKSTTPQLPSKLSHFFKSITITYERPPSVLAPLPDPIVWKKPTTPSATHTLPAAADFDVLEFERDGDENVPITISLERDDWPERFQLSSALAELLDMQTASSKEAVEGVMDYIKVMGLLDDEKNTVRCDSQLKAIFRKDILPTNQVAHVVSQHFSPIPPIKLSYTIQLSPPGIDPATKWTKSTIYDIPFLLPTPLSLALNALAQKLHTSTTLRQIIQYDEALALCVQAIRHSKARHKFFKEFSKDPADFLKRWLSSQQRDMEVILGEQHVQGGRDEFERGGKDGVWGKDIVRETVGSMFATGRAK